MLRRFSAVAVLIMLSAAGASAETLKACMIEAPFAVRTDACNKFLAKAKPGRDRAQALIERGTIMYRQGDRAAALADYEAALKLWPDNAYIFNNRGAIRRDAGDQTRALEDFNKAVSLGGDVALFRRNRGNLLLNQRKPELALPDLEKAVALAPKDAWSQFYLSQALARLDKAANALAAVKIAVEIEPGTAAFRMGKSRIESTLGQFKDAVASCREAVRIDEASAAAWECLGDAQEKAADLWGAKSSYQRALKIDPNFTLAWAGLGDVHLKRSEWRDAEDAYTKALERDGNPAYVWPKLAKALGELHRHNEALEVLERLIAARPRDVEALRLRGATHSKLWNFTKAFQDLDAAIAASPESAEAFKTRGDARFAYGDWKGALSDYTRYTELQPKSAEAWHARGRVLLALGDRVLGIADLERASQIKPDDFGIWLDVVSAYRQQGELDVLRRRLDQRIAIDPTDMKTRERRKQVNTELKRYDHVIEDIRALAAGSADQKWRLGSLQVELLSTLLAAGRNEDALREVSGTIDSPTYQNDTKAPARFIKAAVLARAGNAEEALRLVAEAVALDPNIVLQSQLLPDQYQSQADDVMLAELSRLIAAAPTPALYKARAALFDRRDEHSKAADDYLNAVESDKGTSNWARVSAGQALIKADRTSEAISLFTSLIDSADRKQRVYDRQMFYEGRASAHRARKAYSAELADLEQLLSLTHTTTSLEVVLRQLRTAHQAQGSLGRHLEQISTLLRDRAPQFAVALRERAETQYLLGKVDATHADLASLIEMRPTDIATLMRRAQIHTDRGRFSEAIADRRRVIDLDPRNAFNMVLLGNLLQTIGDTAGSIDAFSSAVAIRPDLSIAFSSRALVHISAGNSTEALADADRALALGSRNADAMIARARAHLDLGNTAAAQADLDRAIELSPKHFRGYFHRSVMHDRLGDTTVRITDARKALELIEAQKTASPLLDHWTQSNRAVLLHLAGEPSKALAQIENALEMAPNIPASLETRATIFAALGRREEAIADLRRAISRDPTRKASQDLLARLEQGKQ
jgi:tetratricopeptide (TPR) repeat protein